MQECACNYFALSSLHLVYLTRDKFGVYECSAPTTPSRTEKRIKMKRLINLLVALLFAATLSQMANAQTPQPLVVFNSSFASLYGDPNSGVGLTRNCLATGFTPALLSTAPRAATITPYPVSLSGISVVVAGREVGILYVGLGQINFFLPNDATLLPPGTSVLVQIKRNSTVLAESTIHLADGIDVAAPFYANGSGSGTLAAVGLRVLANGTQVFFPLQTVVNGLVVPAPIQFQAGTRTFIVLYMTGVRAGQNVILYNQDADTAIGVSQFTGASQWDGVTQVNLELSSSRVDRENLWNKSPSLHLGFYNRDWTYVTVPIGAKPLAFANNAEYDPFLFDQDRPEFLERLNAIRQQ